VKRETNGKASGISLQNLLEVEIANVVLDTTGKTGVHGCSSGKDDVLVKGGTEINVSGLDGVEELLGETGKLNSDSAGLKEGLGRLKTLSSDLDDTTVGELVGLHEDGGVGGKTLLKAEIASDVAELLLDLTDGLEISGAVKVVSAKLEELDEVLGDITTGDVETVSEMRE